MHLLRTKCLPILLYLYSLGAMQLSSKNVRDLLANVNVLRYVCYMLSAVRLLSVVCLSVTLVHPTQAVKLFGNFFHNTIAQGLYFSGAKNRWWGTPLSPEICVQSDPPLLKQHNFDKYRLIAPQPS